MPYLTFTPHSGIQNITFLNAFLKLNLICSQSPSCKDDKNIILKHRTFFYPIQCTYMSGTTTCLSQLLLFLLPNFIILSFMVQKSSFQLHHLLLVMPCTSSELLPFLWQPKSITIFLIYSYSVLVVGTQHSWEICFFHNRSPRSRFSLLWSTV